MRTGSGWRGCTMNIPIHAQGHLHHFVGVGVVHVGSILAQREFIRIRLTRLDVRLGQAADAVHAVGQKDAVPVNGRMFGQVVGYQNADPIAFHRLDGRSRGGAVVAPAVDHHAGCKLALHRLGDQVEHLDTVVHRPGQAPAVEGDNGACTQHRQASPLADGWPPRPVQRQWPCGTPR